MSLTSQSPCYWVLAVYLEVGSALSSALFPVYAEVCPVFSITGMLGTGGAHGSGLPSQTLWCWVLAVYMEVEYWRCTWKWSTGGCTWKWSTGGVHGSGLPSQTLWCWALAVYMEVEYWRCTWRWSTGGVHGGGVLAVYIEVEYWRVYMEVEYWRVYMEVEYWRCTWRWSLPSQTPWY